MKWNRTGKAPSSRIFIFRWKNGNFFFLTEIQIQVRRPIQQQRIYKAEATVHRVVFLILYLKYHVIAAK